MKIRSRRKAAALALLTAAALTLTAPGQAGALTAKPAPLPGTWTRTLPHGAVPGSTSERRAAWNALTPARQRQVIASFERTVTPGIVARAAQPLPAAAEADWKSLLHSSAHASGGPAPSFTKDARPAAAPPPGTPF